MRRARGFLAGATIFFALQLAICPTLIQPPDARAAAETCGPISPGVAAGFKIDGQLFCSGGLGFLDWYKSAGNGCLGVLDSPPGVCGVPIAGLGQTLFVQDSVAGSVGNDPTVFTGLSNTNDDLIGTGQNPWHWGAGSVPQKDDLTETYVHITPPDINGDIWMIVGAAYRSTSGDKHFDFEFNQKGITESGDFLIGNGPDGGRVAGPNGDIILSIDYQQGGASPCVHLRQWRATGTGSFAYVQVNACTPPPGVQRDTAFSAVSAAGTPVPCLVFASGSGATRTTTYEALQFAEAAVNLSCYLPAFDLTQFCNQVSTVMVKTRSSGSSGFGEAQLKDFVLAPFTFIEPPTCSITDPGTVCAGVPFELCGPVESGVTYTWTGPGIPAGQANSRCITPTVASAGTASYHLVVERSGCGSKCERSVTVTQVTLALTHTDVTCNGAADGTITATFSGGTAPYQLQLDGGSFATATSPTKLSSLGPGLHTVVVKDASGCQDTKQVTIDEPTALALTLGKTDVTCNGAADGTITATFSGGTTPYQIQLDGGSFSAATSPKTFNSLGPGTHTVVVKDANSCQISKEIGITEPPALALSLGKTDVTCNGAADGTITATFSGGTTPYQIQLDGGGFASATSPTTFNSLGPGVHTVVVKDANSCQISKQITVTEPPALALTLGKTDATCNGGNDGTITATFSGGTAPYQIQLNGGGFSPATSPVTFSSLGTGSYTVDVKDANNCQKSQSVSIGQPGALTLSLDKTDITCNGAADGTITATFSGGTPPYQIQLDGGAFALATSPATFSSLAPGTHTVVLKDANNCQTTKQATLAEPPALTLALAKTDVTCNGAGDGSITATFSGGTPPYQIQLDGGTFTTATSPMKFSSLGPGAHTVVVKDAHSCQQTKQATINEPAALVLALTKTDITCEGVNGTITATFSGGTPPYQLQIDGGAFTTETSPWTFTGLTSGSHTVVVKDANACQATQQASILTPQCGQLTPTQTTCSDFTGGTAGNLTQVCYGIKGSKINNAAPGVFFYYTKVTATSPSFTINVVQTNNNASFPLFGVQQGNQVFLYDAFCNKIGEGTESSPGQASVAVSGASVGEVFIVSVKYVTSTVVGTTVTGSPKPTVHYNFRTEIGGQVVDADPDGLNLQNCVGGATAASQVAADGREGVSEFAGVELYRPAPNPFGQGTRFVYEVAKTGDRVQIAAYDLSGRRVRMLGNGFMSAGRHQVIWDGRAEDGTPLRNGVYFIRTQIGDFQRTLRVAIIR